MVMHEYEVGYQDNRGRTLRIKKATICSTALRCSSVGGVRISRPKVDIKSGVLFVAMSRTAARACAPTFCGEISFFLEVVANMNNDRRISMESM